MTTFCKADDNRVMNMQKKDFSPILVSYGLELYHNKAAEEITAPYLT
jgi:hypothetical protein